MSGGGGGAGASPGQAASGSDLLTGTGMPYAGLANPQLSQAAAGANGATSGAMPMWQKGLMGLATGSSQYGQNAPAMHQALSQMVGGAAKPQQQGAAPPMMMRAPMAGMQQVPGMGQSPQSQLLPQAAGAQQGAIAPWMMNRGGL